MKQRTLLAGILLFALYGTYVGDSHPIDCPAVLPVRSPASVSLRCLLAAQEIVGSLFRRCASGAYRYLELPLSWEMSGKDLIRHFGLLCPAFYSNSAHRICWRTIRSAGLCSDTAGKYRPTGSRRHHSPVFFFPAEDENR